MLSVISRIEVNNFPESRWYNLSAYLKSLKYSKVNTYTCILSNKCRNIVDKLTLGEWRACKIIKISGRRKQESAIWRNFIIIIHSLTSFAAGCHSSRSCASVIQVRPGTLAMPSAHLVAGRPTYLYPILKRHSVRALLHLSPCARCHSQFHFSTVMRFPTFSTFVWLRRRRSSAFTYYFNMPSSSTSLHASHCWVEQTLFQELWPSSTCKFHHDILLYH